MTFSRLISLDEHFQNEPGVVLPVTLMHVIANTTGRWMPPRASRSILASNGCCAIKVHEVARGELVSHLAFSRRISLDEHLCSVFNTTERRMPPRASRSILASRLLKAIEYPSPSHSFHARSQQILSFSLAMYELDPLCIMMIVLSKSRFAASLVEFTHLSGVPLRAGFVRLILATEFCHCIFETVKI